MYTTCIIWRKHTERSLNIEQYSIKRSMILEVWYYTIWQPENNSLGYQTRKREPLFVNNNPEVPLCEKMFLRWWQHYPKYDVTKRIHFLYYWTFALGIHRSLVDSPHKGTSNADICVVLKDWNSFLNEQWNGGWNFNAYSTSSQCSIEYYALSLYTCIHFTWCWRYAFYSAKIIAVTS